MGNFTKIDDQRVNAFIEWSQDAARYELYKSGRSSPSIVEINYWAWQLLMISIRRDAQHRYDDDYDAAAAEHYMYIRFLAGQTGDPACHAAPTMYAATKVLNQLLGRLQAGRTHGEHPVLPANPYIVGWGHKGVVDGLADYRHASGGASYNPGQAVESLARFAVSESAAKALGEYAKTAGEISQVPYGGPRPAPTNTAE